MKTFTTWLEMRQQPPPWANELFASGGNFNSDGTITLYHATTKDNALKILAECKLRRPPNTPDEYGVYGSTSLEHVRESYGGDEKNTIVVAFDVNPNYLHPDDFAMGRWLDFRIKTQNGVFSRLSNVRIVK